MKTEWNGDEILAELQAEVGRRVEKAAIHLENEIRKKLNASEPYHIGKGKKGRYYHGEDPSKPGDPPKKIRGDLQRSITYKMADDKMSATVGTGLDYGFFLEVGTSKMQPRPFLRNTLLEQADAIKEILGA